MPRIAYLQDDEVGPANVVAAIRHRRGGHLLNLDRLLLYSPNAAAGWNHLLGAVRNQLALDPKLREIAMCAVATMNEAPYEFHHHAPELLKAGGTQDQVLALADVASALTRTDLFDRSEMAVLRVAVEMTQSVQVEAASISELQHALGDARLVFETVLTVAAYNMVSRVIVALDVEPEAPLFQPRPAVSTATPAAINDSGRINVPGAAIAYRLEGPPKAPVLMLANGLAADMGMWDAVVERLSPGFRVLRYDMRGHGMSSTPPGPYGIETLASDAIALMDALEIGQVHFVGHSLGATVGQQLAARYPNRISTLVLCAKMETQAPAWKDQAALVQADGLEAIAEEILKTWFTSDFHQRQQADIDRARAMILGTRAQGWLACLSSVRDPAPSAIPAQVHSPTLILAAAHDGAATPVAMRLLANRIAGAEFGVIAGAAHMAPVEQPSAIARALNEFVSRHVHLDAVT